MSAGEDVAIFNYTQFRALADKAIQAGRLDIAADCQQSAEHWWAQAGITP